MMDVYWLEQTEADLPAENDWLSTSEVTRLNGMRFAKRHADWRLGRWTAKRALALYLNLSSHPQALTDIEVRPAPSGAPEVFIANPPAGIAISLSHRAGWRRAYLYVCKGLRMTGQVQVNCQRTFRRPASQPPVGVAFGKTHAIQAGHFAGAQPVIVRRQVGFGLLQPIHVHHACPTGETMSISSTLTSFWIGCLTCSFLAMDCSVTLIPRSTASMR